MSFKTRPIRGYNMARLLLATATMLATWGGGRSYGGAEAQNNPGVPITFAEFQMPPPPPEVTRRSAPPCAVTGEVCEEDPEYNQAVALHISSLIRQDTNVATLLSDRTLSSILNDSDQPSKVVTLSTRFADEFSQESPVCAAQETLIYPKRAKTPGDDWVFVVNQQEVQQALKVEKCINDGESCNIGMALPGGATAICRQKYVYRRMLTLGSNRIHPEEVLMPSCCVCYTNYSNFLVNTRQRNNTNRQPTAGQPAAMGGGNRPAMPVNAGRVMRPPSNPVVFPGGR